MCIQLNLYHKTDFTELTNYQISVNDRIKIIYDLTIKLYNIK